MNKKTILTIIISIIIGFLISVFIFKNDNDLIALPKPEITDGIRSTLGIDKNINEETIDKYLNRSDSVYRDMRMLKDPGNYEAIGGDSYLSGIIEGFEVIPYPYLEKVEGLPEAVGNTYTGKTLFTKLDDGTYKANYQESLEILEYYFPKDKFTKINGKIYNVIPDYSPYDIVVETFDNYKLYIEVKSTRKINIWYEFKKKL